MFCFYHRPCFSFYLSSSIVIIRFLRFSLFLIKFFLTLFYIFLIFSFFHLLYFIIFSILFSSLHSLLGERVLYSEPLQVGGALSGVLFCSVMCFGVVWCGVMWCADLCLVRFDLISFHFFSSSICIILLVFLYSIVSAL